MQTFHSIVIGAGPAGLTCARILAEHGFEVLVLERNRKVGPKICGGGITWKGLIRHVPEHLIERSFRTQHIRTDRQKVRITSATPIIATVEREKLGTWMQQQAIEAGALIRTDTLVTEVGKHIITVKTRGGTTERLGYRYLIGADGSSSIVRKYLRLPTRQMGIGIHYRVAGDFNQMEWHLHSKLFSNGYAWIFPYNGSASVGIYTDGASMPAKSMQAGLHQWSQTNNISLQGVRPRAGLINFDYRGWRFGNILLAGDAAGLASGLTGEGMYPAIVSGEAAARTIIDPLHKAAALNRLVRNQRRHRQVLAISRKNHLFCSLIMELLTLGLRTGIIPFSKLEMAD